jgi:phenylacetate-CoA ligase
MESLLDFRPELSWEFLSAEEIRRKSVRAMRNHVRHVKECSAFYKTLLKGIEPEDITSFDDVALLPLTTRKELADQSSKFLGVAPGQIVETVMTGGSGGRALPFVYTQSDLDRIAFNQALSFHSMGMTQEDRVHLLLSLDQYSLNGMAHYRGAIMVGANIMRIGAGMVKPDMLSRYLKFFKPTVIIGTPSALSGIGEKLPEVDFTAPGNSVNRIICTGESVLTKDLQRNTLGVQLEKRFNADVYAVYSVTELSVAYGECSARTGAHAHPELVYTEVVDPEGIPVPDGEVGELVATPLGVEGVPLLRYRTGDITFKVPGTCSCGRNSCRIGPILGRSSDPKRTTDAGQSWEPFSFKGTAISPESLIDTLDTVNAVKDYLIIIENDSGSSDSVTIQVAAPPVALAEITQSVKSATGQFIPILISNIPTIQSLRDGSTEKIPLVDHRRKSPVRRR